MNDAAPSPATKSPFWPVFLTALSVAGLLGWQAVEAGRQHAKLKEMSAQQAVLVGQAVQTEAKLQAIMMDVLKLARTDADAQAIVTKYKISFNPGAAATPALSVQQPGAPSGN